MKNAKISPVPILIVDTGVMALTTSPKLYLLMLLPCSPTIGPKIWDLKFCSERKFVLPQRSRILKLFRSQFRILIYWYQQLSEAFYCNLQIYQRTESFRAIDFPSHTRSVREVQTFRDCQAALHRTLIFQHHCAKALNRINFLTSGNIPMKYNCAFAMASIIAIMILISTINGFKPMSKYRSNAYSRCEDPLVRSKMVSRTKLNMDATVIPMVIGATGLIFAGIVSIRSQHCLQFDASNRLSMKWQNNQQHKQIDICT